MREASETGEQDATPSSASLTFWAALIGEHDAADFLGLSVRTMQAFRQRGNGPPFLRLSPKCVRYRRTDLSEWAEARLRTKTMRGCDVALRAGPRLPLAELKAEIELLERAFEPKRNPTGLDPASVVGELRRLRERFCLQLEEPAS